jgi:hypothetical protein
VCAHAVGAAGNASSWYDTATIVTNVRNFPNNRGAGETAQAARSGNALLLLQVMLNFCASLSSQQHAGYCNCR